MTKLGGVPISVIIPRIRGAAGATIVAQIISLTWQFKLFIRKGDMPMASESNTILRFRRNIPRWKCNSSSSVSYTHLEDLFSLIRIPSISAKPEYHDDMLACAERWAQLLDVYKRQLQR